MVTSVNGNDVTWRSDSDNQLYTDSHNDLELVMQSGGGLKKLKRGGTFSGGYIDGPSHEAGGVPMRIKSTGEVIEVEGDEYVLNAETTKALGVKFLDKLNSTATRHHPASQGFNRGALKHMGSNYAAGGKIGFGITYNTIFKDYGNRKNKNNNSDITKEYKATIRAPENVLGNSYPVASEFAFDRIRRPVTATRWDTLRGPNGIHGANKMWEHACYSVGSWEARFNPAHCYGS